MAMINVIFNRPVRIGKTVYPKSKRSVAIDDKAINSSEYLKKLVAKGDMVIPAASAAKVAAPAAAAAKDKA